MKTNPLIIGISIFVGSSILSVLGLIAGQELNNQGDMDIFPDDWNATYNPAIGHVFAWMTITFIPVSIAGVSIIMYGLFTKFSKQIAIGIGVSLLSVYVGIIVVGYPYT